MKYFKLWFASFLLFASCSVFALDEIRDVIDVPVPNKIEGAAQSLADVKLAILAGSHRHGWTGDVKGPNLIVASLLNRGHAVAVEISFTQKTYSVKYLSSQNMDYDEKKHKIHKKYNSWVASLVKEINSQLFQKSLAK